MTTATATNVGKIVQVIGPVAVDDLGVQVHREVGGGLDLADQVVRHRTREAVSPHHGLQMW